MNSLPLALQLGPINDYLTIGEADSKNVLVIGNDFGGPPFEGNFDAFQGTTMRWKENKWGTMSAQNSGFHVFKDAKEFGLVHLKNGKQLILVSQNQDRLLVFIKK